jgi:hypothetical protein
MSDSEIRYLVKEMQKKKDTIREWSRSQMIKVLVEKKRMSYRGADRKIAEAEARGYLKSREVDKAGRKRFFLNDEINLNEV